MKKILALSMIGGTVAMLFTGCTQKTVIIDSSALHKRPIVVNQGPSTVVYKTLPQKKVIVKKVTVEQKPIVKKVIVEKKPIVKKVIIEKQPVIINKVYSTPTVVVHDYYYDDCDYYDDCY